MRTDQQGRITYMNSRWSEIIDNPEQRLPDFGWHHIIRPEDVERITELGIESLRTRQPFMRHVHAFDRASVATALAEGGLREFWGEIRAVPLFDQEGQHTGFAATLTNVSREVAAAARADRLAAVLDASLDYVLIASPTGSITYANGAAFDTFEVRIGPQDSATFLWDVLDRDSVEYFYDQIEPILHSIGSWRGELRMRTSSGRPVPVSAQLLAHTEIDGNVESVSLVPHRTSPRSRRPKSNSVSWRPTTSSPASRTAPSCTTGSTRHSPVSSDWATGSP